MVRALLCVATASNQHRGIACTTLGLSREVDQDDKNPDQNTAQILPPLPLWSYDQMKQASYPHIPHAVVHTLLLSTPDCREDALRPFPEEPDVDAMRRAIEDNGCGADPTIRRRDITGFVPLHPATITRIKFMCAYYNSTGW